MAIRLDSISFNHDPDSAAADAINIRRNRTGLVPVPEWRQGVNVLPSDSVAAYAINTTTGNTLTIQVQLSRTDSAIQAVQIRAVNLQLSGQAISPFFTEWPLWVAYYPYPWNYYLLSYYLWILNQQWRSPVGSTNVLGEVKEKQIQFREDGHSGPLLFELPNQRIEEAGVGVHTVVWRWQYRTDPMSLWQDFAQSSHEIYVILDIPTLPWHQQPYDAANTQLPWSEALEVACTWAKGADTLDEAASEITQSVFNLGEDLLEYGCQTAAHTQYAFPGFNCTEFLNRLRGGFGMGPYVNCTDCATIVSTFANLLGCDLWQSRMGEISRFAPFTLNPILAIGSSTWQSACGSPAGFLYHEVAWKGACGEDEEIFDACLMVDGGEDPTRAPHIPLLPANIRFGRLNEVEYRSRLVAPETRQLCDPQPFSRTRRWVY